MTKLYPSIKFHDTIPMPFESVYWHPTRSQGNSYVLYMRCPICMNSYWLPMPLNLHIT